VIPGGEQPFRLHTRRLALANDNKGEEMRITVDPSTESSGFDYVNNAEYRLRVVAVTLKKKEYPYLNWELEIADPNVKGTKGGKPGHIFEITTLKSGGNAQFRLRQICDALGLTWGDFDTDETIGRELDAYLKVREYQGVFSNEVDRFIPLKK